MKLLEAPLPLTAGSPGLTQGCYGDVGNLELVVPDPESGFWVFWFNADAVEQHAGAAVGCWSGGLHVPGVRSSATRIAQLAAGPRFLEVIAVGEQQLHRSYWTPADGFVDGGILSRGVIAASAVIETSTALHIATIAGDHTLQHLRADRTDYPLPAWTMHSVRDVTEAGQVECRNDSYTPVAVVVDGRGGAHHLRLAEPAEPTALPGRWSRAVPVAVGTIGLDLDGVVQINDAHGLHRLWPDVCAVEITAADTLLDGGRIDVVLRRIDGVLLHAWGRELDWTTPRPVVSRVWSQNQSAPVHRR